MSVSQTHRRAGCRRYEAAPPFPSIWVDQSNPTAHTPALDCRVLNPGLAHLPRAAGTRTMSVSRTLTMSVSKNLRRAGMPQMRAEPRHAPHAGVAWLRGDEQA